MASQVDFPLKPGQLAPEARDSPHPMLIGGKLVQSSSGLSQPVINPATGEPFDYVPYATKEDLDAAVSAAVDGFKVWSAMPFSERAACLLRFGELVKEKEKELSEALSMEQGKPLAHAAAEVKHISDSCAHNAANGDLKPETLSEDDTAEHKLIYMPRGVVGGITPWNFPLHMAANKMLPSIIVGNTCVIKPSPFTPLATVMLSTMAAEAFPAGVMNILTGGDALGQQIVEHPDVAQITFTGSTGTGRKIMATGAATIKKVTLELGGNDAAIVLPDIDPADAAPKIFDKGMWNSGQVCIAIKRVFVHESRYEEMVTAMKGLAEQAKTTMNDGLMEGTMFGPINNKMQLERVEELVEDAKRSGARVVAGGKRFNPNGKNGYFYEPTVLADVQEGVRVVDEEQFGPVIPLIKYSDVEDALERANNSEFGLGGSVWTNKLEEGAKIAARLKAGMRGVNDHPGWSPHVTPFGGIKQSGVGREDGFQFGLKEFVDVTSLKVAKIGIPSAEVVV